MRDDEASRRETELKEALSRAGLAEALPIALATAGLSAVPSEPDEFGRFVLEHVQEALFGHIHPATARELVEDLVERVVHAEAVGDETPTVPPPPSAVASDAYGDLASGAIHTPETPVWGIQRPSFGDDEIWVLVSADEGLIARATADAPAGTEVMCPRDEDALRDALTSTREAVVVLDAAAPSLALERVIAALTSDPATRVLLWRMPDDERARLADAAPHTRTWLACEAEVTPAEILQLLGA